MRILMPLSGVFTCQADLAGRRLLAVTCTLINTDIIGHEPHLQVSDREGHLVADYPVDATIAAGATERVTWAVVGEAYRSADPTVSLMVACMDGLLLEEGDIVTIGTDGTLLSLTESPLMMVD